MKNTIFHKVLVIIVIVFNFSSHAQNASRSISFKENKGQVSDQNFNPRPDVLFSGIDGKILFHLKTNGISYQLDRVDSWTTKETPVYSLYKRKRNKTVPAQKTIYRIDVDWLNVSASAEIQKGNALAGYENYYGETCPNGVLNVKSYEDVIYKNLYPGIDLKWYEKNGSLEYDYSVAAFADYKKIKLEYKGAEKIYINKKGELIIQTPLGTIAEQKPLVIQNNKILNAEWKIENNIVSFDIRNVDPSLPLVIDPMVRLWGTYYGGSGNDIAFVSATDNAANVYVTGWTESTSNIATSGAYQSTFVGSGPNVSDAFLVKFDPTGLRLWATYYGGSGNDYAGHCVVDGNGTVIMVGGTSTTNSAVMATPGAHQSSLAGTDDAFIAAFNSSGIRQWGTYYGGNNSDWGGYISQDATGDILITGGTTSTDGTPIATPGCHQSVYGGGASDGFLATFNSSGVRHLGTYYGGLNQDIVSWGSSDAAGNIYISGYTQSATGIATPGGHQPIPGGNFDGLLVQFNSAGVRQWGTYYGGPFIEYLGHSAVDASGNVYLCGTTAGPSNAITTPGCHQATYGGGLEDGLFVKFNSSGVRQWGTYYGGLGYEYGGAPSIDVFGDIYFVGTTTSQGGIGIVTPCAYQTVYGGGSTDAFIQKFTPAGTQIWGTYFGGPFTDEANGCKVDIHGNVYLSGTTLANSANVMTTPGAHQTFYGGMTDSFIEKFNGCIPGSAINTTPQSNLSICLGDSTTLTATCGNWYSSPTGTTILATGPSFTTGIISSDSTFYVEDFGCGSIVGPRTAINITIVPLPSINIISSNTTACVAESITLTASGASTYSWQPVSSATSTLQMFILLNVTHTVFATDANGCKNTATISVIPQLCTGINERSLSNNGIIVYPNPNNGNFTIRSGTDLNLILSNELGQTLRSITLSSENNFETTLKDLSNGVYFLNGKKGNRILNQKIIVLH